MRGFRGLAILFILAWTAIGGAGYMSYLFFHSAPAAVVEPVRPDYLKVQLFDSDGYELKANHDTMPPGPAEITSTQLDTTSRPLALLAAVKPDGDVVALNVDQQGYVTLSDEDIARIAKAVVVAIKQQEDVPLVGRETGPNKNSSDFIHVLPVKPDTGDYLTWPVRPDGDWR